MASGKSALGYLRPLGSREYVISVDYGYDVHSIQLSAREWRRVEAGACLRLVGHGFPVEGEWCKDRWVIDGKTGLIDISCDDGFEIYGGKLSDKEVQVPSRQAYVQPLRPASPA